ncbi:MAG: filamentous hemagglutinin N-terminal domain-containing protein, partial [Candidatus Ratteibacteria bacterium]
MIPRKIAARLCLLLATVGLLLPMQVFSLPNDPSVVAGQSSISQTADQMTITQTTDKAIINWGGYSIDVGELVQYLQPGANAVSLNRIVGGNPSEILGQLIANGQIFLINPSGIVFGEASQVNVPGLLATTLNISDEDFLAGNYTFSQDLQSSLSAVINKGTIIVQDNGYCVLVAPLVSNEGLIVANMGKVALGGAESFTVNFDGQNLINFAISAPAVGQPGTVLIPTGQVGDIIKGIVNSPALVEAGSVVEEGGMTYLGNASGTVVHSGTITVDGVAGKNAGSITIDSNLVSAIVPGAVLSASGVGAHSSGGEILILSDMEKGTALLAEGSTVEAKGGDISGDAGFVELSGSRFYLDNANIDLTVIDGNAGTFLLDPYNITIGNVDAGGNWSSGNYTPTGSGNTISHSTIESYLAGSHVIVSTGLAGSPGGEAGNISLESEISSATNYDLTLEAAGAITFKEGSGSIYRWGGSGKIILRADTINITPVDPVSPPYFPTPITHYGSGSLDLYVNTLNIGPVSPGERVFDVHYMHVTTFTPDRNIVLGATESGSLGLDKNFFDSVFADSYHSQFYVGDAINHTGNIIVKGDVDSSFGRTGFASQTYIGTKGSIFSDGGRIKDAHFLLDAGGNIDLLTQAMYVRALSTGGSITIRNIGDLAISNYVQTSGDNDIYIELTGAGNKLSAGGGNGIIQATGTGDITLVADEISLPSVLGAAAARALNGNVTLRPYSAENTIYLGTHPAGEFGFTSYELSNVYGDTIIIGDTTQSGGIDVTANISTLGVTSSLSLITGGSILRTDEGIITVDSLVMEAGAGIGVSSNTEIRTDVDTLAVTSENGTISVKNYGALTLNGATVIGAGGVYITATGPMLVSSAVSGPNNIMLTANEEGGDNAPLTISADITSIAGSINLITDQDFIQTAGTISTSTGGGISLSAYRDLTISGNVIDTSGGQINLVAKENIFQTAGIISTSGNVSLIADYFGYGIGKIDQQGGSISASALELKAKQSINILDAAVETLAVKAGGNIAISNTMAGGLTIGTVYTTGGISGASLALTETGGDINIDKNITVTNNATLTAAGAILDVTGDEVIAAAGLELISGDVITLGHTKVSTLAVDAVGAVNISNTKVGGLTVGTVDATSGISGASLALEETVGTITINQDITVTNDATITSAGKIAGAGGVVKADNLALTAGTGIMSISPVKTDTNRLTATTETGAIYISNNGALALDGATVTGVGGDYIHISSSGSLTVAGDVFSPSSITLQALNIDDNTEDLTISANITSTGSGTSGLIDLYAGADIIQTTGAINTSSDIYLTADYDGSGVGKIDQQGGSLSASRIRLMASEDVDIINSAVETLAVDAGGDIHIANTMATGLTVGAVDATSGISGASLALTETAGAINIEENITVTNDATLTSILGAIKGSEARVVEASTLVLIAGTGIGTSSVELQTKTPILTATTETGAIYISNNGALTLNGATITGAGDNILIRASSPLTVAGDVFGPGNILLQAVEGGGDDDRLTISANITSTGSGLIDLYAGADIIQTTGAITTGGNIHLIADYDGSGVGKIDQQGGSLSALGLQVRASGDIDIIDSAVKTLAVDAVGAVDISNTMAGGLTVGAVGATSGISGASLALTETAGAINIDEDITVTNNATLTAAGAI